MSFDPREQVCVLPEGHVDIAQYFRIRLLFAILHLSDTFSTRQDITVTRTVAFYALCPIETVKVRSTIDFRDDIRYSIGHFSIAHTPRPCANRQIVIT